MSKIKICLQHQQIMVYRDAEIFTSYSTKPNVIVERQDGLSEFHLVYFSFE